MYKYITGSFKIPKLFYQLFFLSTFFIKTLLHKNFTLIFYQSLRIMSSRNFKLRYSDSVKTLLKTKTFN